MRILSIDSSLGTQLLVCDADPAGQALDQALRLTVLVSLDQEDSRHHAESLGPMLCQALSTPGVANQPLDAVVAATGPAPFTGLRAGLVTARTVGRARGLRVYGVPSLDAVARRALDELAQAKGEEAASQAVVQVATDARRKEVYAARYRAKGADDVERLGEIGVMAPADLAGVLEADAVAYVAGSGVGLYPELAEARTALAPVSGDALAQVRLALVRLAQGRELPTEPLYLRHADVQMPTATKRHR
ncbi:MAG: tRNA (adenosine(37)-N6)-threonylcarbamoyltransferase complex dimerization subunit type 1 TsaB [Actinomyces urogenitalis]|uniref:tRNA (adenosine(37)-N6)-threonylcarbamoyltransferase complex dimerization subunit type 1 TsaB n=1 Tax=Actinomyces urogenitalis TaxID=103621 RepID=UPI002A809155|nr:tRNA (adenosine(37)-N6)-threonylcarbamoyltransferase complex dimerization subunit type 1 TsaB [Actinomyces urogenitalis]MDY3678832.1 tRNA (adenosine(37)-N6)-threonylcarbamoyltransferase complex dimerization subunit type 1 TsaB [Actinomyces urogenitalis]